RRHNRQNPTNRNLARHRYLGIEGQKRKLVFAVFPTVKLARPRDASSSPGRPWSPFVLLLQTATQLYSPCYCQLCQRPRSRTMHNFKRAFKLALAHRFNVAVCVLTATIVAVLWGGNLTAVYPVVEIIMNDHALPDWIDQKSDEAQRE